MDFRRLILFGALGLVLMMIWQSWIQYQLEHDAGRGTGQGTESVGERGTSDAPAPGRDDVPDAPEVESIAAPPAPEVEEDIAPPGRMVNVETDTVRARIDTLGGDLVRVELLKHPVSVETPDDPFVLMHRDRPALYIAQSGLIGTGREYPNHNVEFTPERDNVTLGGEDSVRVVLNWTAPDDVRYRKIYTFHRNSYHIDVDFEVDNRSQEEWAGFLYGQLKQTEVAQPGSHGISGPAAQLQRSGHLYRRRQVRQGGLRRDRGRASECGHRRRMGGHAAALFCRRPVARGFTGLPVLFGGQPGHRDAAVSDRLQAYRAGANPRGRQGRPQQFPVRRPQGADPAPGTGRGRHHSDGGLRLADAGCGAPVLAVAENTQFRGQLGMGDHSADAAGQADLPIRCPQPATSPWRK